MRFHVILESATGGVLEKKLFLKMTIQKKAIKIFTSSNAFFKDFNFKLEVYFQNRFQWAASIMCLFIFYFFFFQVFFILFKKFSTKSNPNLSYKNNIIYTN